MQEELFRSNNLLVRRVGSRGGTAIVTFGSYTNEPVLDRPGFGEDFLRRERIDAIHVVTRTNRWYQYREIGDALAAVAESLRKYDRAITYGSSMGGYAALRFASRLGAEAAIAISPQYSLDPRVVPWERRWQADVAGVTFDEAAVVLPPRSYIFYDPRLALDGKHVGMFAADGPVTLLPLPYGGHPVGALLAETGALQAAFRTIVADRFDPAAIRQTVREGRWRSQHQYFNLARKIAPRRPETAIRLLERAEAIERESHIVSVRATLLDRLGRHDEAAPLHAYATERTPTNALAWMAASAHHEATGDAARAAAALRCAARGQSPAMLLRIRIAQLRLWLRAHRLGMLDRWVEAIVQRVERSPHQGAIVRRLGRGLR